MKFKNPVYMEATFLFVLFLHSNSAKVPFTSSGSNMLHSFVSRFSRAVAVSIVELALPFFFISHA